MPILRRARVAWATCALTLSATSAVHADPPTKRAINGVGSAVTAPLMNVLAGLAKDASGALVVGSYDASTVAGSIEPITGCTLSRPRTALEGLQALASGSTCVQFARTSVADLLPSAPSSFRYVPIARDAVGYVVSGLGTLSRNVSRAELQAIYRCQRTGVVPHLPAYGSDLRRHFLNYLGIADGPSLELSAPYTCLRVLTPGAESDGRYMSVDGVMPYSVAAYLAQHLVAADVRGSAVLGLLEGQPPVFPAEEGGVTYAGVGLKMPKQLTTASLASLFTCKLPTSQYKPALPPFGSETRARFLELLGLADAANFTALYPCVRTLAAAPLAAGTATNTPSESAADLRDFELMPFSVYDYLLQRYGERPSFIPNIQLGAIDGKLPFKPNEKLATAHLVYNVFQASTLAGASANAVFGQAGSLCAEGLRDTIRSFGFSALEECGIYDQATRGTAVAGGKCMAVAQSSYEPFAQVQATTCKAGAAEKLQISRWGDLNAAAPGQCLDLPGSGTGLQQYYCNGTPPQRWSFANMAVVTALNTAKCVDVPSSNFAAGVQLQLWDCNNTAAQKLSYDPTTQTLKVAGLCVDVKGSGIDNGTAVQLYTCNGTDAQRWFRAQGGFVSALSPRRCLDVSASGTANGTKLQLWECNGTAAQRFGLRGPILNPGRGLCLEGSSVDGTQIRAAACTGSAAQTWLLWSPSANATPDNNDLL